MENIKSSIERPLSPTDEYYPDWDYNPSELIRLAVWHKKELPSEAVKKIKVAINDVLGKRTDVVGQWTLDENEFQNLVNGYSRCQTIPEELESEILKVIKYWKKKQNEKK